MSARRTRGVQLLAALILTGAAGTALSQSQTGAARKDGKAFATDIGQAARDAARRTPTADALPHFGQTPSQSSLFDDPDALARAASEAAAANDGYQAVRSSIDRRPRVPVADIEATLARGKTVAADPLGYVSGMGIGGGQGVCRELPPATAADGTYLATCNVGLKLEQKIERCTVPLQVSVTRTTTYRYECSASNTALNGVDDCALFDPHLGGTCEITGDRPGRCLQGGTDQFGRPWCTEPGEPIHALSCDREVPGARILSTSVRESVSERRDESACAGLAADVACSAQGEACTSSDPVTRIIDGVAVTRPCWAWEQSFLCSRAVPAQDCGELEGNPACALVRADCLTDEQPCPTWERVYRCPVTGAVRPERQHICDGDIYCIGGECETIDREPNTEFKDAAVALNAAAQAGREFDPATLTLFEGTRETCHKKVFGLLNCCAGKAFPLLPGASLLVSLGCSREEVLLHERDAQGLCTYVGSYCSDSVLGICVTKQKAYCCFESKLSRILQEQGRAHLGKPWGSPRRETCRGFTVDEFARLDLSRMDFSEVYVEFQDAARLPEELSTVATVQRKISDFYALNGPGR